jgi:hypothetical protein
VSDIRPFLSTLVSATPVRSFTSALPVSVVAVGTSPWSPRPEAAPAQPQIDVAAIRAEAMQQGRDEGVRETAALRAKLEQMIGALAGAQAEATEMRATLISDAAAAVIDAWLGTAGAADKFLPVVRAWQARTADPATAHVHPSEAEMLRAAIGDATMTVVADATIPVGTLQLRGAAHELTHSWDRRLVELREAITLALEVKS